MYYNVRVSLHDKSALYDAVRECFKKPNADSESKLVISEPGNDKFLLTLEQREGFSSFGTASGFTINCTCDQIMQYAHNCVDKPTLLKILADDKIIHDKIIHDNP